MKRKNCFKLVVGCWLLVVCLFVFSSQVSADTNTVIFLYDGGGQRIYRGVNGGEHTYYISPGIEVVLSSGGTISYRISYYFSGKLVAVKDNLTGSEQVNYIHQDHLGSTTLVTSQQGTANSQQVYYPYGSTRTGSGTFPSEREYTGQISDMDQTGLYYYNARYYNPQIAKFTQADSQGDTLNKYTYVGNNPIIFTDPSGNMVVSDGGGGGLPTRRIPGSRSRPTRGRGRSSTLNTPLSKNYPLLDGEIDPIDLLSVDKETLDYIKLSVWAENNMGLNPDQAIEITFWVFLNRVLNQELKLPIFDKGAYSFFGNAYTQGDRWIFRDFLKYTDEEKANFLLENCLMNPKGCPKGYQSFLHVSNLVDNLYEEFLGGMKDPTGGALYFSHQNSLKRTNPDSGKIITFESLDELKTWLQANLEYAEMSMNGFSGGVSDAYRQAHRGMNSNLEGRGVIVIWGNQPCVFDAACGLDRFGADRAPRFGPPTFIPEKYRDINK